MANLGQLLTKKKNISKRKSDSHDTGRTLKAQKTPTSSYVTSSELVMHTQPTPRAQMVAQRHIDTYIHLKKYVIKIIRAANPGPWNTRNEVLHENSQQLPVINWR